jgi:hypothetical protein
MDTLKITISEDAFALSSFKQMTKYCNASENDTMRYGGIYMTRNPRLTQTTEKDKTVIYSIDGKSIRIWDIDGFNIDEGFLEGRFIPANRIMKSVLTSGAESFMSPTFHLGVPSSISSRMNP